MIVAWKITIMFCLFILCLVIYAILDSFNIFSLFNSKFKEYPKLSYKQFVDYYWINPDKWKLYDDYVEYKHNKKENLEDNIIMTKMWLLNQTTNNSSFKKILSEINDNVKFSFSFIDQFKYRKLKYDIETKSKIMKQSKLYNESYQILLNGVQEDIDRLRKQSENELNQAMNIMKEVKERIG